jgi:hypothetical protein
LIICLKGRSKPDTIGGKELVLELNPMKTKGVKEAIRARPSSKTPIATPAKIPETEKGGEKLMFKVESIAFSPKTVASSEWVATRPRDASTKQCSKPFPRRTQQSQ